MFASFTCNVKKKEKRKKQNTIYDGEHNLNERLY